MRSSTQSNQNVRTLWKVGPSGSGSALSHLSLCVKCETPVSDTPPPCHNTAQSCAKYVLKLSQNHVCITVFHLVTRLFLQHPCMYNTYLQGKETGSKTKSKSIWFTKVFKNTIFQCQVDSTGCVEGGVCFVPPEKTCLLYRTVHHYTTVWFWLTKDKQELDILLMLDTYDIIYVSFSGDLRASLTASQGMTPTSLSQNCYGGRWDGHILEPPPIYPMKYPLPMYPRTSYPQHEHHFHAEQQAKAGRPSLTQRTRLCAHKLVLTQTVTRLIFFKEILGVFCACLCIFCPFNIPCTPFSNTRH